MRPRQARYQAALRPDELSFDSSLCCKFTSTLTAPIVPQLCQNPFDSTDMAQRRKQSMISNSLMNRCAFDGAEVLDLRAMPRKQACYVASCDSEELIGIATLLQD